MLSERVRTASRRGIRGGIAGVMVLGLILGLSGCATGKPELVPSDDNVKAAITVRAVDNKFEPAEVEIAKGQAVRWVFEGTNQHDVVSDDGSFVSDLVYDGSYTHVFNDVGDFRYICSIHPEMIGNVKVVE